MDDNNQNIIGSNNNQININNTSGNINFSNMNHNNMEYQPLKTKHFTSISDFLVHAFLKVFILFLGAGITNLFAKVGFQQQLSQVTNLKDFIFYLLRLQKANVHLFFTDLFILALLLISISIIFITIRQWFYLLIDKPFVWLGYIYKKENNGVVLKAKFMGKCPIPTCSGTVWVKKPYPNNEEKKDYVGICSRSKLHTFNFDPLTLLGDRIQLTPKKEMKKEIHNHYYN